MAFYFVSLVRITISFALIKSANLPYVPLYFNRESIEEWYKEEKGRCKQGKTFNDAIKNGHKRLGVIN